MSDGDLWRDRNKVFVAGLPAHADDAALRAKFQQFGEMHQASVVRDRATGRSRGFGFVTYCEYVHALEAVENFNQTKWDGRVLNVRFLEPKSGGGGGGGDAAAAAPAARASARPKKVFGPRPEGCTTVYVGNLAYDITEEVLRKVFAKCGTVKAVRFAEHIQTGEFRGFGYVQFYEEEPCEQAVKLDGMIVMGRPMNIDYGSRDEESAKAREELTRKLKKGVCNKFQTGQCDRGDDCKFAHVLKDQDAEELIRPADLPAGTATYAEAEVAAPAATTNPDAPVCINFQKGKCKRGDACKFQHLGAAQAAAAAAATGADGDGAAANGSRPTPVRAPQASDFGEYAEEWESVDHSHDAAEQPEEEASADADAPVCQNFQKGKCKRGAACRFRHVAAAPETKKQQQRAQEGEWTAPVRVERPAAIVAEVAVCQNFRRGRCSRGASCRFAHTEGQKTATAVAAAGVVEEVSYYQKRFQSICYNWQKSGSCVRGDACPFQHEGGPSGVATASSATPEPVGTSESQGGADDADDADDADEQLKKAKKVKKEKKEKKESKKRRAVESDAEDTAEAEDAAETEERREKAKKSSSKKEKKHKKERREA